MYQFTNKLPVINIILMGGFLHYSLLRRVADQVMRKQLKHENK